MSHSLPNFFIGGATASGTSFLTALLLQHEAIYLPPLDNEPHFFSLPSRYQKGIESYLKTWFSGTKGQKAVGERSTTYLHFPFAAPQLKKHLPAAKFIFVLRDPVERAYAQYRYMVLRGKEKLDFETALEMEAQRIKCETRHFEYTGRSLYGKQLKHFLTFFPAHQILILSSEKLRDQTEKQLQQITDFLEIEPLQSFRIPPSFPSVSVKDRAVQAEAYAHFKKRFKHIIEDIRLHMSNAEEYIKDEKDAIFIAKMEKNLCSNKEPLSKVLRAQLCLFFQDDQAQFFELFGNLIDFKPWF